MGRRPAKMRTKIKGRYSPSRVGAPACEPRDGGDVDRGLLIVFEGIDGCGKSTQLELLFATLCDRLPSAQRPIARTKEPTDGPMGRRIRAMARSGERVTAEEELAWFMEDRREHVREFVEPALARGAVVLSDRYWLSNVAYQGARGLDANQILQDNRAEFPDPDLALIFEISAVEGLARVTARGGVAEPAFEELEFLARAEKVYGSLEFPWLRRIDARPEVSEIHAAVVEVVSERLPGLGLTDRS
jgi:dTMP kinase